jgi:hypothetical protein
LRWLFGKQEKSIAAAIKEQTQASPDNEEPTHAAKAREQSASATSSERQAADLEADNLRRWRESGQARAWVEAHQGRWDHDAWLALLDELKRSPFWPMHPDAVGLVLEEIRREWLSRN